MSFRRRPHHSRARIFTYLKQGAQLPRHRLRGRHISGQRCPTEDRPHLLSNTIFVFVYMLEFNCGSISLSLYLIVLKMDMLVEIVHL